RRSGRRTIRPRRRVPCARAAARALLSATGRVAPPPQGRAELLSGGGAGTEAQPSCQRVRPGPVLLRLVAERVDLLLVTGTGGSGERRQAGERLVDEREPCAVVGGGGRFGVELVELARARREEPVRLGRIRRRLAHRFGRLQLVDRLRVAPADRVRLLREL